MEQYSNCTLSNACMRSTKQRNVGLSNSIVLSIIWRTMKIASVVDLLLLKPCCTDIWISSLNSLFVNSLKTGLSSTMPR